MIITTREQAIAAVESAPWDEYGSALSGADIWGLGSPADGGPWAAQRATSHYTYRSALAECERISA